MKVSVNSGKVLDLAKKALDTLFKGLDRCIRDIENNQKYDLHKTDEGDVEEDGVPGKYYVFEVGDQGQLLEVTMFPIEDNEDSYMIRIEGDNLEKFEKGPVKHSEIEKYVTDYCDKYNLGAIEEGVDAYGSKKLSVTFERVSGSTEDVINLVAIGASTEYAPTKALDLIDEVLSDSNFTDSIPEEPQSYEIVEIDENELDVNPIDSVDTTGTFEKLLAAAVELRENIQSIMWGAKGERMKDLKEICDSIRWDIESQTEHLGRYSVQYDHIVPNTLNYKYTAIDSCAGFDYTSGLAAMKGLLSSYIDAIECFYPNVDHVVQKNLDDWLCSMREKCNFADRSSMV